MPFCLKWMYAGVSVIVRHGARTARRADLGAGSAVALMITEGAISVRAPAQVVEGRGA